MLRWMPWVVVVWVGWSSSAMPDEGGPTFPADAPIERAIDHFLGETHRREKITPAGLIDEAAFLRRVTLDLAGRPPTVAELDEYLGSKEADKKSRWVDRLMGSTGFVRHQSRELLTLLQPPEAGRRNKGSSLGEYVSASVKANLGWDVMFRDLMLPDNDNPAKKGSVDFLKSRVKELDRLTIDVSTTFFGVNVSCAQCHDHPHVAAWTQDHFYGMKSFFARTVDVGGYIGEKSFGTVKYVPNKGAEKVAPVMFLTGTALDVPGLAEPTSDEKKRDQKRLDEAKKAKKAPAAPEFSLRGRLVETALAPEARSFFSRSIVNQMFYRFLGQGLVMPLDQMHVENPPSHPELMAWLADDLVKHQYDLRRLIRGIVLSDAYARSSRPASDETIDDKWFASIPVRPLTPAQMAAALKIASTNPAAWKDEARIEDAIKSAEKWTTLFAHPVPRFQVGVQEAMLFSNNEALAKELLDGGDNLVARLMTEPNLEKRADLAFRAVLNRPAQADEASDVIQYQAIRGDRSREAWQQIVWALMTTAEFRFNH